MTPARIPKEPKPGDEYFSLMIDEETGEHEWWIYRVRSVQNRKPPGWASGFGRITRYVYAIYIADWTWGKLSKKHGHYGWLPNIEPVWRKKWRADEEPRDLFKTKKAALKYEIATYDVANYDSPDTAAKVWAKLQNMLKRQWEN